MQSNISAIIRNTYLRYITLEEKIQSWKSYLGYKKMKIICVMKYNFLYW